MARPLRISKRVFFMFYPCKVVVLVGAVKIDNMKTANHLAAVTC